MILVRVVRAIWLDVVALLVAAIVFIVPFAFIFLTAGKDRRGAADFQFSLPSGWHLLENLQAVVTARNGLMVTALWNSLLLTVFSVAIIVVFSAMVGFVLQRRRDRIGTIVSALMLIGLTIPPAVVPTIFVLQTLGIFKTLFGLILVEVAYGLPFGVLIFRAFAATIPRELDEAAVIDGAGSLRLFYHVILPLLRPAIITVTVVQSVFIYNDFVNPLYFLPGNANATVQLTLYTFISQFNTQWNLLFADVLLITIPPLVMFLFFQRQIVSGLTAGAVKG